MNILIRKAGGTALALAMSAVASMAQAQPVTSWTYSQLTKFTRVNTFTAGGGDQIQTDTQTSWGATGGSVFTNTGDSDTNRSGITISDIGPGAIDLTADAMTGTVITGATAVPGIGLSAWITHHNNPISGGFATLLTSQIQSSLTLTPLTPLGGPLQALPTLDFTVFFAETLNSPPCTAASPVGNPCNDIFALQFSQAFNKSFVYDGLTYFASLFPVDTAGATGSFLPLSAEECRVTGAGSGCVGFTTVEGVDTTVRFGIAITPEQINPVPEPGSLALMGLGLMGFAAARRKRKNA